MIYVVGSINMDLVATVSKMPKKGETMSADSFYINSGGKGANQAAAIGKLGGTVSMIGKVGKDSYAKTMTENLKSYGVNTDSISEADGTSGIALILVQNGDNRIILDKGANYKITAHDVDKGLSGAKSGDILLMQLEIPLEIVQYALTSGRQKGMINILNPAPAVHLSDEILSLVDIITPNETETKILTEVNPKEITHIALAVKKFYKSGVKNVVITLGKRGSIVSCGQEITEIPSRKVKVVDTTGAGDTFVGAIAVKLSQGLDLVSACKFANVASSITIQRKGAAISIPRLEEVEQAIKEMQIP